MPGGFGDPRHRRQDQRRSATPASNEIPLFGLCLGMQLSIIEFARNVLHLPEANSHRVRRRHDLQRHRLSAGTIRRASIWAARFAWASTTAICMKSTLAYHAYRTDRIRERHRHRYEFNNKFKKLMEKQGMVFSGINPETKLCEIIELKNHPWFVATQFHPEFLSRPDRPHPLFKDFIGASVEHSKQ
ncbi:MAG: gamma-glutamyl-gamma-aminobutyrate hydrolase family protein [Bacillus subtilis]|nr:gamma-glutamyl-gamma-aminobutyrate hydrolase family protein [Bacillus subtilis]